MQNNRFRSFPRNKMERWSREMNIGCQQACKLTPVTSKMFVCFNSYSGNLSPLFYMEPCVFSWIVLVYPMYFSKSIQGGTVVLFENEENRFCRTAWNCEALNSAFPQNVFWSLAIGTLWMKCPGGGLIPLSLVDTRGWGPTERREWRGSLGVGGRSY